MYHHGVNSRRQVLYDTLRENLGEYQKPIELCKMIGCDMKEFEKILSSIVNICPYVTTNPLLGVRLDSVPEKLVDMEISHQLSTSTFGKFIYVFDQVTSTNDVAVKLALSNPPGMLVVAEFQSRGRGRRGHTWQADGGASLLFSILLPEIYPPIPVGLSTMLIAGTMAKALTVHCGVEIRIKWPNDLVVMAKGSKIEKLGGVLCEIHSVGTIAGIGINVNQESFPNDLPKATSIRMQADKFFNRNTLLNKILHQLELDFKDAASNNNSKIVTMMRNLSVTIGNQVTISTETGTVRGMAIDLLADGSLLVEDDDHNRHRLLSGDITSTTNST